MHHELVPSSHPRLAADLATQDALADFHVALSAAQADLERETARLETLTAEVRASEHELSSLEAQRQCAILSTDNMKAEISRLHQATQLKRQDLANVHSCIEERKASRLQQENTANVLERGLQGYKKDFTSQAVALQLRALHLTDPQAIQQAKYHARQLEDSVIEMNRRVASLTELVNVPSFVTHYSSSPLVSGRCSHAGRDNGVSIATDQPQLDAFREERKAEQAAMQRDLDDTRRRRDELRQELTRLAALVETSDSQLQQVRSESDAIFDQVVASQCSLCAKGLWLAEECGSED